jgi:surface-adhesin protein E/TonB-like protein
MTNRLPSLSRTLLASAILVAVTASANEPEWHEVTKDVEAVAEVDTANILIDESRRTAWVRITMLQDKGSPVPGVQSVVFQRVFDCDSGKSGALSATAFAGPRGTGEVIRKAEGLSVDPSNLKNERPGTNGHKVLAFVCEQAQLANVKKTDSAEKLLPAPTPARIVSTVDPALYFPPGAKRRQEQGAPVVKACVGPNGQLVREPVIAETSGFPEIDAAAIKIAKANRYSPGVDSGPALPESCIKFRVKFVLTGN